MMFLTLEVRTESLEQQVPASGQKSKQIINKILTNKVLEYDY